MYNEMKNHKKLKVGLNVTTPSSNAHLEQEIYNVANAVLSAILHSRILGITKIIGKHSFCAHETTHWIVDVCPFFNLI